MAIANVMVAQRCATSTVAIRCMEQRTDIHHPSTDTHQLSHDTSRSTIKLIAAYGYFSALQ